MFVISDVIVNEYVRFLTDNTYYIMVCVCVVFCIKKRPVGYSV